MILAILFAVLGYRKAEETGRNKALWAFLMVVIFIGVQLAAGMVIGVFLGIGVVTFGWSENIFEDYYWPINIGGIAISVAACVGVLHLLGRTSKEDDIDAPPPPSQFGLGQQRDD